MAAKSLNNVLARCTAKTGERRECFEELFAELGPKDPVSGSVVSEQ